MNGAFTPLPHKPSWRSQRQFCRYLTLCPKQIFPNKLTISCLEFLSTLQNVSSSPIRHFYSDRTFEEIYFLTFSFRHIGMNFAIISKFYRDTQWKIVVLDRILPTKLSNIFLKKPTVKCGTTSNVTVIALSYCHCWLESSRHFVSCAQYLLIGPNHLSIQLKNAD